MEFAVTELVRFCELTKITFQSDHTFHSCEQALESGSVLSAFDDDKNS